MAIVSKDKLIKKDRVLVGTVTVPVEGGEVRVRGLTRTEFHKIQTECGNDAELREIHICAAGLIAPEMTVEEVTVWSTSGPAGEIQDVSVAIGRLSRLVPESAKEATKSVSESK